MVSPTVDLSRVADANLRSSQVLRRAARSALYRRVWGTDLERFAAVETYAGLRTLPFVSGRDLRAMESETAPDEWLAAEARTWVCTSGTTGTPKWIPIADADLALGEESDDGIVADIGALRPDELTLALNASAPYYSDLLAYATLPRALCKDLLTQILAFSVVQLPHSITFALRQGPRAIIAFPSVAMALAEGMTRRLPELLEQLVPHRPWLTQPLAWILQHVIHLRPHHIFRLRWGIFGGEPLAHYRQPIRQAWGMESLEVYGMSELRGSFGECDAREGIHIWTHRCIPEIIPLAELEQERDEGSTPPAALPLWQAPTNLVGELVLTTFSHALPLIRYRTADLVQVAGSEPCRCGRYDPRLRVLHRADDIVNLGIVRFSLEHIAAMLGKVRTHGCVADWQLRVTRAGYKPHLVARVRGEGIDDEKLFAAEVRSALLQVRALAEGLANQLVAAPEIQLDPHLSTIRTASGKVRRLVYEKEL